MKSSVSESKRGLCDMDDSRTYKKSRFNLFVPYKNDEYIVYNMLSNSIGKMDAKTFSKFNLNQLSLEETDICVQKGLLISPNFDEVGKINGDRIEGLSKTDGKNFRIWSTSACNARCYYCFEKGIQRTNMPKKLARDVVGFIDTMTQENDSFNIEWFGGEPLLNIPIIEEITSLVSDLCRRKHCKVQYSMISNGSLIEADLVKQMKEKWHLKSIQITLDGYADEYNAIKNYYNSEEHNFCRVIENIKLLVSAQIHVGIRMNYDANNYKSLAQLIEYLHKEFAGMPNIRYYVYPVWTSLIDGQNQFISSTEADKQYLNLLKLLVTYNMGSIRKLARLGYRKYQCHACHKCGFSIFPNGKIGKCDETFTQTIGDIWDGVSNEELYHYWTSPDLDEQCIDCIYLPICQGGCRSYRHTHMPQCFAHKNILPDLLKWYVEYMETQRKKI